MNVYYANAKHENLDTCKKHNSFGLKSKLPSVGPEDVIILRVTGHSEQLYRVEAIWKCIDMSPGKVDSVVTWTDGEYNWLENCSPIVEYQEPFC